MRQLRPAAVSASKMWPFSNARLALARPTASNASGPLGLLSSPPDEAACTKHRLGHVGPGMDENQLSISRKFAASVVTPGVRRGGTPAIAPVPPLAWKPVIAPLAICAFTSAYSCGG